MFREQKRGCGRTNQLEQMVKTVPFGDAGINIPQPGFGAMGLSSGKKSADYAGYASMSGVS